jgi:REP element-mobilizing transposase RayT
MPHQFQISHDSQALFLTVVTKNRLTVFRKDELKEVVCRALDEARRSAGFLLFAYVIMLDHLHLLTNRPSSTSDVLRVVKSLTARRVIDYLKARQFLGSLAKLEHQEREKGYKYSLWQSEKNVLSIFSEQKFMEKVNYIHQNPVQAGLVERAVDYRWSSARIWHGCPLEDEPLLVDKDLISWRKRKP